jgi:hypothetical protein
VKTPSTRVLRYLALGLMPLFSAATIGIGVGFMFDLVSAPVAPNRFWSVAYGVALICTGLLAGRAARRTLRRTGSRRQTDELRAHHEAIQRAAFPNRPWSS